MNKKVYWKAKNEKAYTLIEILVVVIIIGILAAIAAPNFLSLLNRNRVREAFSELEGAVKETQRQAIRLGRSCKININTSTNLISGNPSDCLLSNRTIKNNIIIRTNLSGSPPNILFSHKGSTTKSGTVVISSTGTDTQKCFVISLGLGIMRTGEYIGSKTGSVSATNCRGK